MQPLDIHSLFGVTIFPKCCLFFRRVVFCLTFYVLFVSFFKNEFYKKKNVTIPIWENKEFVSEL